MDEAKLQYGIASGLYTKGLFMEQ